MADSAPQLDRDATVSSSSSLTENIICQNGNSIIYLENPETPNDLPVLRSTTTNNRASANLESRFGTQLDQNTKIFVVISILSGTHLAEKFADSVLFPLLSHLNLSNDGFEVIRTTDANSVIHFTRETLLRNANNGIPQLVILLSGDGGLVDILNASTPRSSGYVAPEISLIPMGTGNALANSSGLTDPTYGLSTLVRGQPKKLPTFKVRFSAGARLLVKEAQDEESLPSDSADGTAFMYGAVVCSWGMHAALVADSDTAEYRKHGAERFKMAANEALYPADGSPPHQYKAKVSVRHRGERNWTSIDRTEHAYVLTTLVSSLEKGFTISPASKPLDGSMRIVHFGPMSGDEVMRLMTKAYQGGKHVDEASVAYAEVDGVRIAFNNLESDGRWRRICVDGKIIRVESDGYIEIERQSESPLMLKYLG